MARPFKILSDFDGVWTNQGLEAEENVRRVAEVLAELLALAEPNARAIVDGICDRVLAAPDRWGWAPDGERISAYVDEDPLCLSSAVCQYIDRADDPEMPVLREAIQGAFPSLAAFSEHCFVTAMQSYRARHPPCIVEDARAQLQSVLDRGAEVVVVSNSSAEKIGHWFTAAGIDAGTGPDHQVRLRGSAGKQFLGESDDSIVVAGRDVRVDRPRYRIAIEQEQPDLIIGDVFSLDLALPHVMRTQGQPAAPRTLVMRRHAHTPSWIVGDRAGGAIDHLVECFADLANLLPD